MRPGHGTWSEIKQNPVNAARLVWALAGESDRRAASQEAPVLRPSAEGLCAELMREVELLEDGGDGRREGLKVAALELLRNVDRILRLRRVGKVVV
jgi:hypothetical protein